MRISFATHVLLNTVCIVITCVECVLVDMILKFKLPDFSTILHKKSFLVSALYMYM